MNLVDGVVSSDKFWYEINDTFGSDGGIYMLYCEDKQGQVIPVARLLGEDHDGILYIGMATSFLDRVIELKKSLSPEYISSGHECGVRYKSNIAIAKKFPFSMLRLTLVATDEPRKAEQEALSNYLNKFGEFPPLNRVA